MFSFSTLSNYLPAIINFQSVAGCSSVIRSKSQFWSVLYTPGFHPRASPLLLSPPTPDVHPVNYFVSGYLQRAVNSCRADYTDRFIALVSQSNVRNAPLLATHAHPDAFQASLSFSAYPPPSRSFRPDFGCYTNLFLLATDAQCCRTASNMEIVRLAISYFGSRN